MPDDAPTADQFWLLTGDVPTGPFTIAQIHAKLASGEATWQTQACFVGGGRWLPLMQMAGIGPRGSAKVEVEPQGNTSVELTSVLDTSKALPQSPGTLPATPHQPAPPPAPQTGPPALTALPIQSSPADGKLAGVIGVTLLVFVIGVVGVAGYGIYEWVRPLSATQDSIQGSWRGTNIEAEGKPPPREIIEKGKYVFKGNKLMMFVGDTNVGQFTFTLDPTQKPQAIDITETQEPGKGTTMYGIYRIVGDTLTICFGYEQRPSDFKTVGTAGVITFKRATRE